MTKEEKEKGLEKRINITIDNLNAMLAECKDAGVKRVNIKVGDYEYSHPVFIKLKLKSLRR